MMAVAAEIFQSPVLINTHGSLMSFSAKLVIVML
jgi:hypothetical protein